MERICFHVFRTNCKGCDVCVAGDSGFYVTDSMTRGGIIFVPHPAHVRIASGIITSYFLCGNAELEMPKSPRAHSWVEPWSAFSWAGSGGREIPPKHCTRSDDCESLRSMRPDNGPVGILPNIIRFNVSLDELTFAPRWYFVVECWTQRRRSLPPQLQPVHHPAKRWLGEAILRLIGMFRCGSNFWIFRKVRVKPDEIARKRWRHRCGHEL